MVRTEALTGQRGPPNHPQGIDKRFDMSEQDQFLDVIDRDEAQRRFEAALRLEPLGVEKVPLHEAWGRVLAVDVVAPVDVPSFDRSNFDGFALQARDTYGADEETPRRLQLLHPILHAGQIPDFTVRPGEAVTISTGAMLPRGADAILMVEHAEVERPEVGGEASERSELLVRRASPPGFGVTFAGTDISAGETVLWRGEWLTSRETGVLAAIGVAEVSVWRRASRGDHFHRNGALCARRTHASRQDL
jgi:putative molybdopterin biosynthesis protein